MKNRIIMLADDNAEDRELFQHALAKADPDALFFTAQNGCEALERLQSRGFAPDIIFLDIQMPKMDGIECLQKIKESEQYKDIIIVMYSGSADKETKKKCLALGADVFIEKPSDVNIIKEEIEKILNTFS